MAATHDSRQMYLPVGEVASVPYKSSIHSRFIAGFVRQTSGELIHCFGPWPTRIVQEWPQIQDHLSRNSHPHNRPSHTYMRLEPPSTDAYIVFEIPKQADQQFLGIVLTPAPSTPTPASLALDTFFAGLVLRGLHVDIKKHGSILRQVESQRATDSIVHLFDAKLRHVAKHDKWLRGGRDVFRKQVSFFTSRGAAVEFCLPAFPCKSSSSDKVLSASPDRGEYIALTNLQSFMQQMEDTYKPGAKLCIISDGHVFSDCIGVDDEVVDTYAQELQAMNKTIAHRLGGKDNIRFKSLPELFDYNRLCSPDRLPLVKRHPSAKPIATKTTARADLCRHILNMGFRPGAAEPAGSLMGNDAELALYRGFSKFMLQDLATNKYTSHLSRSQLRKKASEVAKEMIQRNQAYSNLVEMMFPHHVRLSIHSHDNSGPKFGIRMLGQDVTATDVLPPRGAPLDCCDDLHIPTPWHNCMVEVDGCLGLYTTKASTIWPAVQSGRATWVNNEECGGYVYLKNMEALS